jgi:hypothetical protein
MFFDSLAAVLDHEGDEASYGIDESMVIEADWHALAQAIRAAAVPD